MVPEAPNAVKFETFLFDILDVARGAVAVEVDRAEAFSPIKNPIGADSVASCRKDISRRNAHWLGAAGVTAPRGPGGSPLDDIEIDPALARNATELAARLPRGVTIRGPTLLDPHGAHPRPAVPRTSATG